MIIDPVIAGLRVIEKESDVVLDDDSIGFLAEVRSANLLSDDEWNQIKQFLQEALQFIREQKTVRQTDGAVVMDLDADPRNANWLRIDRANRLAGYVLPMWAALWLWWLRTDTSAAFWRDVGTTASKLGCEPFPSKNEK